MHKLKERKEEWRRNQGKKRNINGNKRKLKHSHTVSKDRQHVDVTSSLLRGDGARAGEATSACAKLCSAMISNNNSSSLTHTTEKKKKTFPLLKKYVQIIFTHLMVPSHPRPSLLFASLGEEVGEPVHPFLQARPVQRVTGYNLPRVSVDFVQRQTLCNVHG